MAHCLHLYFRPKPIFPNTNIHKPNQPQIQRRSNLNCTSLHKLKTLKLRREGNIIKFHILIRIQYFNHCNRQGKYRRLPDTVLNWEVFGQDGGELCCGGFGLDVYEGIYAEEAFHTCLLWYLELSDILYG